MENDLCQKGCLLDGLHGHGVTASLHPTPRAQHVLARVSMICSFAACDCPTELAVHLSAVGPVDHSNLDVDNGSRYPNGSSAAQLRCSLVHQVGGACCRHFEIISSEGLHLYGLDGS